MNYTMGFLQTARYLYRIAPKEHLNKLRVLALNALNNSQYCINIVVSFRQVCIILWLRQCTMNMNNK